MSEKDDGIGVGAEQVVGFRTPFLGYNDHLFAALVKLGFRYDTTLMSCFADDENGSNCAWPYTLGRASPDAKVLAKKFSLPDDANPFTLPEVTDHRGLWEIPPTGLVVPPDELAAKYGFSAGLQARIQESLASRYPSVYEPKTGKISGMDYTILVDAKAKAEEMAAILKYNLDLHITGNRAPLVFVGHAHLYAFSSESDNPDTPTLEERDARIAGLKDFVTYALSKPEVRIVGADDIRQWMVGKL